MHLIGRKKENYNARIHYGKTVFSTSRIPCYEGTRRPSRWNCLDKLCDGEEDNDFYWDVKEKIHSLLMFDIVQADAPISDELKEEIEKDGVVIYEKV